MLLERLPKGDQAEDVQQCAKLRQSDRERYSYGCEKPDGGKYFISAPSRLGVPWRSPKGAATLTPMMMTAEAVARHR